MYYKLDTLYVSESRDDRLNLDEKLAAIPVGVTEFDLSNCTYTGYHVFPLKAVEVFKILKASPANVTSINFSLNNLGNLFSANSADLIYILKALPKHLASLNLSHNYLNRLSADSIFNAVKTLPEDLRFLNLSSNDLANLSVDDFIKILKTLPAYLASLDLGWNNLNKFSADDLVKILNALPANLTSLNLYGNGLYELSDEGRIKVLQALPRQLTSLNLGGNFCRKLSTDELTKAFTALPERLSYLGWSENGLHRLSANDLADAFTVLPKMLTYLDLSRHYFSNDHIEALFNFLRESRITTLGLESSNLMRLEGYNNISDVVIEKLQGILLNNLRLIKSEAEIRKNARLIAQGVRTGSLFEKLPTEIQVRIASETKNSKVHTEKDADLIVIKNLDRPKM